jgi:ribosomal-protein-alanine N-acetyltransferase
MNLKTKRLILRPATHADIPLLVKYISRNRQHLAQGGPPFPADQHLLEFWTQRVDLAARELAKGKSLRLFPFKDGKLIGNVSLTNIVRGPFLACHLGYAVDHAFEGQGLMREAVEAVVHYGFEKMGLHRIMANYQPVNKRSGALLKRLGFVEEGLAKQYLYIDGEWRDHVLTSLISPRKVVPPRA